MDEPYQMILAELDKHLTSEDDRAAWVAVLERILPEADYLCPENPDSKFIELEIGCCSRWLRSHQTRWRADGGFAWPTGYAGRPYSRMGLPQHDWRARFYWNRDENRWQEKDPRKRYKQRQLLRFRVSVPARTTRHNQAAVFTIWSPGTPPLPNEELVQFYGFRKIDGDWTCTATSGSNRAYNAVANQPE